MSFVLALIACFLLHIVPASFADGTPTALSVSESLLEAFNQHDPEAMAALVTEDFELFYISEGKTALSVAGREGLAAEMTSTSRRAPKCNPASLTRSTVRHLFHSESRSSVELRHWQSTRSVTD
jgi:hypothetical protein